MLKLSASRTDFESKTIREDQTAWQTHEIQRGGVVRLILLFTVLKFIVHVIGIAIANEKFTESVCYIGFLCVASGVLFMFPKLRNHLSWMVFFCIAWTVVLCMLLAAAVVFLCQREENGFLGVPDTNGEPGSVVLVVLQLSPLPYMSILGFAAMGIPMRVFLPVGVVLFAFKTAFEIGAMQYIGELRATEVIVTVLSSFLQAALTLHFAWAAETHHRSFSQSLKLLKLTVREWMAQKDADRAARGRIVGYIFHEVRNPLNNIMLASDLLIDRLHELQQQNGPSEITAEIGDMLDTISKASDSACHVLNDALSLQKLEAGTFEFVKQPFSLSKFQAQAVRVATPQMQQKHINFLSEIDPALEVVNVIGDFNRLQQVLNNFLSNAYKFTPTNGTVKVKTTLQNDTISKEAPGQRILTVRVSVQDSGVGIPEAYHSRIFQAWSQIRAGDLQRGQGTGLGLSLCKAFVEVGHGGEIGFTSAEGQGSCFFFEVSFAVCEETSASDVHTIVAQPKASGVVSSTAAKRRIRAIQPLPAPNPHRRSLPKQALHGIARVLFPIDHNPTDAEVPGQSSNNSHPVNGADGNGGEAAVTIAEHDVENDNISGRESTPRMQRRETVVLRFTKDVLVVDDSLVTRKLLCKVISGLGVSFDTCEDGKQAVERITEQHCTYKLVLMDKEMPLMDGFEATRALREAQYALPVVGLTGNAMDQQVADYLSAGANDVFSKPIKRDALIRLLHQYNIDTKDDSTQSPANLAQDDFLPSQQQQQQLPNA